MILFIGKNLKIILIRVTFQCHSHTHTHTYLNVQLGPADRQPSTGISNSEVHMVVRSNYNLACRLPQSCVHYTTKENAVNIENFSIIECFTISRFLLKMKQYKPIIFGELDDLISPLSFEKKREKIH